MGGPIFWFFLGVYLAIASRFSLIYFAIATLILAYHPMPSSGYFQKTKLSLSFYKYFSYRFVWTDNAVDLCRSSKPWIGAGPPHGVMPFANVLSMPAINTFVPRKFSGSPASIVFHTPFLRYLTLAGRCIDVSGKSIEKELARGNCVGMVPDGIAGIFQCGKDDEVRNNIIIIYYFQKYLF